MNKSALIIAVVVLLAVVAPLAVVADRVAASGGAGEAGLVLWLLLCLAVGVVAVSLFRAIVPVLRGVGPELDDRRVDILEHLVGVWSVLLLLPAWFVSAIGTYAAFVLFEAILYRALWVPCYARLYEPTFPKPHEVDETVRWLFKRFRRRLTRASTQTARRVR